MNTPLSLRVPYETGEQLRSLAGARNLPVTEMIALLLDHAARTGFCDPPPLPGLLIVQTGDILTLKIDNFAAISLPALDALSIGTALRNAATGAKIFLDMDTSVPIEISRIGSAVVIKVRGEHGAIMNKYIARGVAIALADRLETVAREVQ